MTKTDHIKVIEDAFDRQCENVAFLLNKATIPDEWYNKFVQELIEDRKQVKALAKLREIPDLEEWHIACKETGDARYPEITVSYSSFLYAEENIPKLHMRIKQLEKKLKEQTNER